ncbi:hypothetical protein MPH_04252 [Macrophomina phaseolina MS6]|uniref:Uncharacterized protein n=1 Tax=Macrophomina phaseolina (strain MS6) TaxID=1126212 RepID=K2SNV5_MACPH|nr:hypothetical protein MPH_04252 [Macrophomina phaseolina MS6]
MHHYTAHTCQTFARRSDVLEIYKEVAPMTAFSDPPLLCSLLALAALHRAYLSATAEDQERYLAISTSYQNNAIQVFRERVPKITRDNACSLFFFASFLSVYIMGSESMGRTCLSTSPTAGASLESILDWLHLLRGISSILRQENGAVFEWVTEGKLQPLTQLTNYQKRDVPPEQEEDWSKLQDALVHDEGVGEEDERQVYGEALMILKEHTACLLGGSEVDDGQEETVGLTMTWPTIVSEGYVEYLEMRRPGALVILGRYGMLLKKLDEYWWAKGWGDALIQLSGRALPEDWRQRLSITDEVWDIQMSLAHSAGPTEAQTPVTAPPTAPEHHSISVAGASSSAAT